MESPPIRPLSEALNSGRISIFQTFGISGHERCRTEDGGFLYMTIYPLFLATRGIREYWQADGSAIRELSMPMNEYLHGYWQESVIHFSWWQLNFALPWPWFGNWWHPLALIGHLWFGTKPAVCTSMAMHGWLGCSSTCCYPCLHGDHGHQSKAS
jgi:hypothetical protein